MLMVEDRLYAKGLKVVDFVKKSFSGKFVFAVAMTACSLFGAGGLEEILPDKAEDLDSVFGEVESIDQVRINMFMHGTYGIASASLSLVKSVLDMDLKGSIHEKVVRKVYRKQMKSIYERSLMYDEGLFRFEPNEIDSDRELECLALIPVLRSFDLVAKSVNAHKQPNKKIKDLYYLFGWSGMLSQGARREAGVCLYNALTMEKEKISKYLKEKGSKAKIETKLFNHSHGGNVALNLAWVDAISHKYSQLNLYEAFSLAEFGGKVSDKYHKLFKDLPADVAEAEKKARYGAEKWFFQPKSREGCDAALVDQLFLMGAPIQPETWPLIFSDTFGRTINFFSSGDNIQNMDMFSTGQRQSERSVSDKMVRKGNNLFGRDDYTKLVQIKVSLPKIEEFSPGWTRVEKEPRLEDALGKMLYKSSLLTNSKGPSHLEFWFIYWSGLSERLCIRPAPIVVFAPLVDEPWKVAERLKIKFDHSPEGGMLVKELQLGTKKETGVIAECDKSVYQQVKKEFYSRRDMLENKYLFENDTVTKVVNLARRAALFMATS